MVFDLKINFFKTGTLESSSHVGSNNEFERKLRDWLDRYKGKGAFLFCLLSKRNAKSCLLLRRAWPHRPAPFCAASLRFDCLLSQHQSMFPPLFVSYPVSILFPHFSMSCYPRCSPQHLPQVPSGFAPPAPSLTLQSPPQCWARQPQLCVP